MYIWRLTRAESGYDEPNVAVVIAESEQDARLTLIATLANGSDSVAAQFALASTTVEQLGNVTDPYDYSNAVVAIESVDFRTITRKGTE